MNKWSSRNKEVSKKEHSKRNNIKLKGGVKIMNKKILAFVTLSFFALTLVNAALVSYISNSVSADVTVSHPIVQEISTDGTNWEESNTISLSAIADGETQVPFYVRDTNIANVPIKGIPENRVTGATSCDDFKSVEVITTTKIPRECTTEELSEGFNDDANYCIRTNGPWNLIDLGLCDDTGENIIFSYGPDPLTWKVGQEDTSTIVVTFNTWAEGTYTFTSNILPA